MIILITGASSGFGMQLSKNLAVRGHQVYAGIRATEGRNQEACEALLNFSQGLEGKITPVDMDVSDTSSVNCAMQQILTVSNNQLDVVINNAGTYLAGITETFSVSQIQALFNTNTFGAFRVIKSVLPLFREQKRGTIINISSALANLTLPANGLYLASKSALERITESFALELAPLGIETLLVEPGSFNTGIIEKNKQPDDIAHISSYKSVLGELEKMKETYMPLVEKSFRSSTPHLVANNIAELLELPSGKKPFRTVIDPSLLGEHVKNFNHAKQSIHNKLLIELNLENMATL